MTKFMDCIYAKKKSEWTAVPNDVLRDSSLSFKAKGILSLLLSNKDGWKSHVTVLEQMSKNGRDSISSGLKELEKAEYLKRCKVTDTKTGKISGYVWAYTDVKGEFDFNLDYFTANGLSVNGFSVNGKSATKKTNSKKNNLKKNKLGDSIKSPLELFSDYLKRPLTDKEVEQVKINTKGKSIDTIKSIINDFDNHFDYYYTNELSDMYNDRGVTIVGMMFMMVNDYDKFEQISRF
jgi:hypothetical protein